jgi:AcrR family transcriptional regulator
MTAVTSRIAEPAGSYLDEGPALRADAQHNRQRIIDVATETFAVLGLDVSMAEIARRAGVGVATLYRRFPTKEALVSEVFLGQFRACMSVLDQALVDEDPWRGFCAVIETVCGRQALDRGFAEASVSAFPDANVFERERVQAEARFAELVDRAKAAGSLRPDFDPADLTLLIMANGGISTESPEAALAASRRLVAYMLQSFRAHHTDPPAPLPPVAPLQLHDAMCRATPLCS